MCARHIVFARKIVIMFYMVIQAFLHANKTTDPFFQQGDVYLKTNSFYELWLMSLEVFKDCHR